MRAELKGLHSPDIDDLKTYVPEDLERFCIFVQALVGPHGSSGEESFDILICSPRWLEDELARRRYIWGRHYLVIMYYDYHLLVSAVERLCQNAQGDDWNRIATILARYGHWEFEDYRGYVSPPNNNGAEH